MKNQARNKGNKSPVAKHFNSSCRPKTHVDKKKEVWKSGSLLDSQEDNNEEEHNESEY